MPWASNSFFFLFLPTDAAIWRSLHLLFSLFPTLACGIFLSPFFLQKTRTEGVEMPLTRIHTFRTLQRRQRFRALIEFKTSFFLFSPLPGSFRWIGIGDRIYSSHSQQFSVQNSIIVFCLWWLFHSYTYNCKRSLTQSPIKTNWEDKQNIERCREI